MCDAELLNLLYAHFALDPWDIDTLYLSVDGFENLGYKPQNRSKLHEIALNNYNFKLYFIIGPYACFSS